MHNSVFHGYRGDESSEEKNGNVRSIGTRGPPKVSKIWGFYYSKNIDGVLYTCCNSCLYKNNGRNTTNLKSHLSGKHVEQFSTYLTEKNKMEEVVMSKENKSRVEQKTLQEAGFKIASWKKETPFDHKSTE